MKKKFGTIVIANCIFVGLLYIYSLVKKIEIDMQFYLLIFLLVSILFSESNQTVKLKLRQILCTLFLLIISAISFIIANHLFSLMDNFFRIKQNIYYIHQSLDKENFQFFANNIILEPIFTLLIGYIVFTMLFKISIKFISLFKYYEYNGIYVFFKSNTKIIMSFLAIFLVIFGFLPTFVLLVEIEENMGGNEFKKVMNLFNMNILLGFFVAIIPYAFLTIQDSKNK